MFCYTMQRRPLYSYSLFLQISWDFFSLYHFQEQIFLLKSGAEEEGDIKLNPLPKKLFHCRETIFENDTHTTCYHPTP